MSIVTTVRQGLGIRGKTLHTGRGSYWMHSSEDLTWADVQTRLELALTKWKKAGLIESIQTEGEDKVIIFNESEKFGYYRKLRIGPSVMVAGPCRYSGHPGGRFADVGMLWR